MLAQRPAGRPDPAARHRRRPVVSKGRKPITVTDWTGKNVVEARTALERQGLRGRASTEEYSDTVAEGDVISQSPADGHALPRRHGRASWSRRGPSWSRSPAAWWPRAVEAGAGDRSRRSASRSRIEHVDDYLGLGYVYSVDPGLGHRRLPEGIRRSPSGSSDGCRRARRRTTLLATLALLAVTAVLGHDVLPDQGPARAGPDPRLPGRPVRDRQPSRWSWSRRARSAGSPATSRRHAVVLGCLYGVAQILQTAGPGPHAGQRVGLHHRHVRRGDADVRGAVLLRTRIARLTWAAVALGDRRPRRPHPRRLSRRLRRGADLRRRDALRAAHRRPGRLVDARPRRWGWRSCS